MLNLFICYKVLLYIDEPVCGFKIRGGYHNNVSMYLFGFVVSLH